MTFCIDTIAHDAALRPDHGLLRIAALCVTSDADANARRLHDEARAAADTILQEAHQQTRQITERAEQQALERMRGFMAAFDTQYAAFSERSQALVIRLALGLFDRLILSITDRERVESLVKRLALEAPAKLSEAMLHLHPSDMAHLPNPEWPVKADTEMAPGTALLVASSGEWRMEFDVAVATLKSTLQRVADESVPP
ncbi:HrpE/YscL family type III secretion apparatus protein [Actimicrobium antarcticum]|uniref:Flagellar assembly protein FliH/Type III secretion system HrpE domain-containing protein n=1 Tax=Actimicrobium antarcticum TaxID=1051899 RepID=A0ABP7TU95_9BURK